MPHARFRLCLRYELTKGLFASFEFRALLNVAVGVFQAGPVFVTVAQLAWAVLATGAVRAEVIIADGFHPG